MCEAIMFNTHMQGLGAVEPERRFGISGQMPDSERSVGFLRLSGFVISRHYERLFHAQNPQ